MSNNNLLLSIIVPVYKTEQYLRKCFDSIYDGNSLNFDQFEVIVVNDGSPDNSQSIIEEYKDKYTNFKYIIKENGGLSSARNKGLEIARGRFIYFIDSDDSIDAPNLVVALNKAITLNADLVAVGYHRVDEFGLPLPKQDRKYYSKFVNQVVDGATLLNKATIFAAVWVYLFDRMVIQSHNLLFIEGKIHEDEDFTTRYLCYTKRFTYSPALVYHYLIRNGSIMTNTSIENTLRSYHDFKSITFSLSNLLNSDVLSSRIKDGLKKKINMNLIILLIKIRNIPTSLLDKKREVNEIHNSRLFTLYPINVRYLFTILSFIFRSKFALMLFTKCY